MELMRNYPKGFLRSQLEATKEQGNQG